MTALPGPAARVARRNIAAAVSVSTAGVLPGFLVGAVGVQLGADLNVSIAALGTGPAVHFGTAALASATAGRFVERLGARAALRIAAAGAAVSMTGVATVARSWPAVLAFLAVGGLSNAVAQPASNLLLARGVGAARRATAFAMKQSAIPSATLLAGLAVPSIAVTFGWRWAFAAGACVAALTLFAVPRVGPPVEASSGPTRSVRGLAPFAAAAGLGAAAAGTLATFVVATAVSRGVDEGPAGLLLAGGSLAAIVIRIALGFAADRRHLAHEFRFVSGMLGVGGLGYALLAADTTVLLLPAVLLAFGAGWGWPGLFNHSVVATNPESPAVATGITQTGVYLGAMAGPLVFGAVVDATSFTVAWATSGAVAVAASLALRAASERLDTGPAWGVG